MWMLIFQRMAWEFLLDFLYFPLWWYTGGILFVGRWFLHSVSEANYRFAPFLWLKNIFVPMYGQTDLQGRLVSIFIRMINVFGRFFALVFAVLFLAMVVIFWFLLPILLILFLFLS
ncbi:MAG: hypothetical protein COV59_03615 [Candidatus Magasanikbacteria bacterium CG11_big_fil_rev_8_21_14_0_20_39_34]|uniref:Uncharacterized protein n=1 Tax=Candidatus Magasanikbacteria bacterium CG11_big_fil_rev_8_21_14_0_20_39_34 TaxID=1974653 RepID=A0A2H0N5S6_9BACT|nr:MAG: hypothetical protein COV59_03615 [Candidatus Magasanikbacteria bacterium CG11_big_fil_rev_8_21_14_0_20_39_34]